MSMDTEPTADATATDPLQAGLAQFQRAALEAIGAARLMLEAAEVIVRDPAAVEAALGTVAGLARTATETVSSLAADVRNRSGSAPADHPPDVPSDGQSADGGFERIVVE